MSQTTGKTSTYIKNANVKESTQVNTGFKKVRFLHQATGGDTLIQLGSLVTPTGAVNYSAPSPSDLAQTNMMQWPGNVSLTSSIAGRLIQNISYVITGAATIKLLYDAQDGEIFEGIVDYGARTGLTLVDAAPIIATGTLAAGNTDFNVGTPFQVGLYSSSKVGSVMVFVDGQLMDRNDGNNAPGAGIEGDYYEVHSGSGLGTIIRFNTPDLVNDRAVRVVSVNGLVERPNGSLMAVAESLQGQIDAMVPTLAELAEVPTTNFQGTPNQPDLKAFGDRVLSLETTTDSRLDALESVSPGTIRVSTANGKGATNTQVWRFTNIDSNTIGGDVTYTDSATLGGSFTINTAGWYFIQANWRTNAAGSSIITRNAITVAAAITDPALIISQDGGGGAYQSGGAFEKLNIGDVIRLVSDVGTDNSAGFNFRIIKMPNWI